MGIETPAAIDPLGPITDFSRGQKYDEAQPGSANVEKWLPKLRHNQELLGIVTTFVHLPLAAVMFGAVWESWKEVVLQNPGFREVNNIVAGMNWIASYTRAIAEIERVLRVQALRSSVITRSQLADNDILTPEGSEFNDPSTKPDLITAVWDKLSEESKSRIEIFLENDMNGMNIAEFHAHAGIFGKGPNKPLRELRQDYIPDQLTKGFSPGQQYMILATIFGACVERPSVGKAGTFLDLSRLEGRTREVAGILGAGSSDQRYQNLVDNLIQK
jgi:hypothetical protein